MSSQELTEWMAYERLAGPLGPERGDYQAALVAATVANAMSSKRKRHKIKDFLLPWGGRRKRSPEELYAAAKAWVQRSGGTITHRGGA